MVQYDAARLVCIQPAKSWARYMEEETALTVVNFNEFPIKFISRVEIGSQIAAGELHELPRIGRWKVFDLQN